MSKILIIEDDPKLRKNLSLLLTSEGFDVITAENGKIGIDLAKKEKPDLIICDIMMPEADGYEVINEISKDDETNSIPFIFLTAKSTIDDFRTGMNYGADDYIFKPFKVDDLLSAINLRISKSKINNQKIDNVKKYLSSKVSHELRTPLVPIIGYSELLEEEEDLESIKEMSKTINYSSKILFNKIEKFILFSDLVINPQKFQNIDDNYGIISNQIFEEVKLKIDSKLNAQERLIINLNHNDEIPLKVHKTLLNFILTELIENGLKFSENKPLIVDGNIDNENYVIMVKDFGVGFDPNEISQISAFEKFSDDNISSNGFGLGLEIVKKIAELNNYHFSIKSLKNSYTITKFIIPILKETNKNY